MKIKFEIKHRVTAAVLFSIETESMRMAVEAAIKSGADLRSADLRYADLRYANLRSADLRYADLSSADLRYADLRYANLRSADLRYADLRYADLSSADLRYANLRSANLRLPTGETLEEYFTQTVPALLTAGGKKLEEVATPDVWKCHSWCNCPMAVAFGVNDPNKIPILFRPRAEQFVQLFDANQIPLEKVLATKN